MWSDALENHPGSSIIYSSLGGAYSDLGEDEKAIFNFKKAFKAAIYFLEAYVSPEMPLSGKKEYGAALGELDAASNYSDAYYGIANIYKVSGNNKKVMRFCEKAIKINPNNTKAYLDLCVACGNLGDFKEAIQACSRAVELNPILAPAHYNLSVAYYFDKRYNLAMLHLQAALKLGWKTPPGFLKEIEQKLTNPKD